MKKKSIAFIRLFLFTVLSFSVWSTDNPDPVYFCIGEKFIVLDSLNGRAATGNPVSLISIDPAIALQNASEDRISPDIYELISRGFDILNNKNKLIHVDAEGLFLAAYINPHWGQREEWKRMLSGESESGLSISVEESRNLIARKIWNDGKQKNLFLVTRIKSSAEINSPWAIPSGFQSPDIYIKSPEVPDSGQIKKIISALNQTEQFEAAQQFYELDPMKPADQDLLWTETTKMKISAFKNSKNQKIYCLSYTLENQHLKDPGFDIYSETLILKKNGSEYQLITAVDNIYGNNILPDFDRDGLPDSVQIPTYGVGTIKIGGDIKAKINIPNFDCMY